MITPPKLQSVPSVHLRDIIPLHLSNLTQSAESRAHGSGGRRGDGVGTSAVRSVVSTGSSPREVVWNRNSVPSRSCDLRNSALARLAVPDADGVTLNAGLAAEGADVLGVLGDLHLLDRLTQRGTVSLQVFGQHHAQHKIQVLGRVATLPPPSLQRPRPNLPPLTSSRTVVGGGTSRTAPSEDGEVRMA